jgi:hypothetical protein
MEENLTQAYQHYTTSHPMYQLILFSFLINNVGCMGTWRELLLIPQNTHMEITHNPPNLAYLTIHVFRETLENYFVSILLLAMLNLCEC